MKLSDLLIQLTTITDWSLPPEEDRLSIARSFAASMEDFHRRMSELDSDEDIDLDSSNSGSELHVTYLSKKFTIFLSWLYCQVVHCHQLEVIGFTIFRIHNLFRRLTY